MRKIGLISILIIILSIFISPANIVKADTFSDDTLIYTQYNKYANFYDNLDGITCFDVSDKFICYTLDSNSFYLVNKTTKNKLYSSDINLTFSNISEIYLTKNFLFIGDTSGLKAYNLLNLAPVSLTINSNDTTLPILKDYSISEDANNLVIAGITDNKFTAYFYNPSTLEYLKTYTNEALDNKSDIMLNVATTTTNAYIVNNATNSSSSSLWSISYANEANENTPKLFPKPNIVSIAIYNYNDVDYLLAVDNKNIVYVLKTNLEYSLNSSDFDADQTISGNSTDTGFLIKDISQPERISVHNQDIYISDSGTKCIQKFAFEIVEEKGTIIGKEIVIASECGEIGRFNSNANIDYSDNLVIVADTNNKRIQILDGEDIINLNSNVFGGISLDNLNNLKFAVKVNNNIYFTTYNSTTSTQNIFSYNLNTASITYLSHSIAEIQDIAKYNNYIYFISTNGMFSYNTTTNAFKQLSSNNFVGMKLSANETNLILTDNQKVYLYNTDGNKLSEININYIVTDLCLESNNLFVLNSDNNQLLKYQITNNNLTTTAQTITNESLKFYSSITIDNNTGIIYLFDNNSCKIDRLINPTFNFKQNIGTYQVNNKSVCVYQRPYFLNGLDTPNVVKTLTLNDRVEIFSKTSISYGNIDYYIILLENNSFGYINKNDLTYLSTIINYEAILPNATLKSYDSSQVINIYSNASTDSEVIAVADTDTRVFVEKYSEDEKFAYIKYYDKNQNLVMGYVSTSSLKLDALSTMQIIALSLIGASIILIIAILITTKIVKKSRLKKLSQE